MKSVTFVILLLPALYGSAFGQTHVTSKDAMKKFDGWAGHWTGTATRTMRGTAENSTVDERIEWRVDGHAMLINGIGKDKDGNIVHEAMGVLSYDTREARYRLHTWLRDGRSSDSWFIVVADNHFQWGFDTPQGKIRYNIWLTDKTWKEAGEFSSDNTQWYPFLEMNLTKQSN